MRICILGSAAGGGFPQWNCACSNCRGVRAGTLRATPRTQASAAVSADGEEWLLLGCSPEVRAQVEAFPALHPQKRRSTPIVGIALCNGDLDHVLGLMSLRESQPLRIFATPTVRRGLVERNAVLRTLDRFPGQSTWIDLLPGVEARIGGLGLVAVPAPGKIPLHLEGLIAPSEEDNVGLLVRANGRTLGWFPTVAEPTPTLLDALAECDIVLFDGTFWSDDELARTGTGARTAREMAHWPVGGPEGSLGMLARLPAKIRALVHVNNTNPLLVDDGPERALALASGVLVAWDGMEMEA